MPKSANELQICFRYASLPRFLLELVDGLLYLMTNCTQICEAGMKENPGSEPAPGWVHRHNDLLDDFKLKEIWELSEMSIQHIQKSWNIS
jgi:hypothetical protein